METKLLDPALDPTALQQAADLLKAGEIVGIPTETVYGLGANAYDNVAVRKIFAAKGRPQDNPLIVHIADFDQIYELCPMVPDAAVKLARNFWPGPLTMIVPKNGRLSTEVSAGLQTIGVRLPSHPIARELIRLCGLPIAAPSANLSGRPSTTTAQHVLRDMNGKIPAVIEGGPCKVGLESTIISLVGEKPRLLRPGGVTLEQLRAVLGEVEVDHALYEKLDDKERVSAPGMKYRHYAPKAPVKVILGTPEKTAAYILEHAQAGDGVLCFDEYAPQFTAMTVETFGQSTNLKAQAQQVFDRLRAFDDTGVRVIYAQCPPSNGLGLAVSNRIMKAAGFQAITIE